MMLRPGNLKAAAVTRKARVAYGPPVADPVMEARE